MIIFLWIVGVIALLHVVFLIGVAIGVVNVDDD